MCPFCKLGKGKYPPLPHQPQEPLPLSKWKKECAPMGHKVDTFSVFAT